MAFAKRIILEVRGGPQAFQRVVLAPKPDGKPISLRVGRTTLSDFVITNDEQMSQLHWELSWDGANCSVRDLGSDGGTLLGGQRIDSAAVTTNGTWVRAGGTDFSIFFEAPRLEDSGSPRSSGRALLADLRERGELFAVLDAAHEEKIIPLLQTHVDESSCLYEGLDAEVLAEVAPYIVRFQADSPLLERLLSQGFGKAWGIYLQAKAPLREVRAHLRRLLVVTQEQDGSPMFFRFFDPRVLRAFLPIATARQVDQLSGPITRFFAEDRGPRLLAFDRAEKDGVPAFALETLDS
jgi:hypothetical protein